MDRPINQPVDGQIDGVLGKLHFQQYLTLQKNRLFDLKLFELGLIG